MTPICAECATGKEGTSDCCTNTFCNSKGFGLSIPDVIRISKKTGLKPREYCRINPLDEADYDANKEDYIPELIFSKSWISLNGEGRCPFLGERGCSIPDAKAKICLIHPFWFTGSGKNIELTWDRTDKGSLCIARSRDTAELLVRIGETEETLRETIRSFLEELKEHKRYCAGKTSYEEVLDSLKV